MSMFKINAGALVKRTNTQTVFLKQSLRYSSTSRPNSTLINDTKKAPAAAKSARANDSATKDNNNLKQNDKQQQQDEIAAAAKSKKQEEQNRKERLHAKIQRQQALRADFSWLPKAPKLRSFSPRELRLQSLYSGYRPVFLEYRKNVQELGLANAQILLDEGPSVWSYSATEAEYYPEWEGVPSSVLEGLKPFDRKLDEKEMKRFFKIQGEGVQESVKESAKQAKTKEVQKKSVSNKPGVTTNGRKRYLAGNYMRAAKAKHDKKLELKRLLQKKMDAKKGSAESDE